MPNSKNIDVLIVKMHSTLLWLNDGIKKKNRLIKMKKDKEHDEKNESCEGNKDGYKPMTDQEVKQLAEDMYRGLVFTDRHLQRKEDVSMVFIPLVLMGKELIDKLLKNPPGMIYEYLDKAGTMSVNGMPMFMSFKMVSTEDTKKVFEIYNKIRKFVEDV